MKKIYLNIKKNINNYFEKNKIKRAVVGLSGGIDSALSCFLAAKGIGYNNVTALILPEIGLSRHENIENAKRFAKSLGVKYYIQPINNFQRPYKHVLWKQNKSAEINLKARIRANLLYNFANANNAIVIGTSNKTELMLGYFTKYGDGACDLEVIGDLYKTEVYKLAKFLKLPREIIKQTPTAELYKYQTDERELGASYEEIDKILIGLEHEKVNGKLAEKIKKRIRDSVHKRHMPIVIRGH